MAPHRSPPFLVVSVGCPAGIGPEIALRAAQATALPKVLVGNFQMLESVARQIGITPQSLTRFEGSTPDAKRIYVHDVGPALRASDFRGGRPTRTSGAAQLAYIEAAYALTKAAARRVLVTAPVSKEVIATSGAPRAKYFRGHTEWLRDLDGAASSTMCFVSERLATSLVTTHLPLAKVPRALNPDVVAEAIVQLGLLLQKLGKRKPRLAVSSLNPHAGEGEMFGQEETRAIAPGILQAIKKLQKKALVIGPIGAETAYRKTYAGAYDGVVAMYHDQATIPMKLVAFGDAVNVTMGLSIVRTSVDHGTAYDIAGKGRADPSGMLAAMKLAERLASA